jgi:hypothetical protein
MKIKGKTIVVWFSCGAASAVAAKKTAEKYGKDNTIIIVNHPVDEEHEDNQRFLRDVEKWLGLPILLFSNPAPQTTSAEDIWVKRKYMSGTEGAPCTQILKKGARYAFEKLQNIDFHVLGFTKDEETRHERFTKFERDNVLPVLIDEQISKQDCFKIIQDAGIELPKIYSFGFPNANCIGCVKSASPEYWNLVRRTFPETFKKRAELSREIGCKLVKVSTRQLAKAKGEKLPKGTKSEVLRVFLDELPENVSGRKLKGTDCGIFCDLKIPKKKKKKNGE